MWSQGGNTFPSASEAFLFHFFGFYFNSSNYCSFQNPAGSRSHLFVFRRRGRLSRRHVLDHLLQVSVHARARRADIPLMPLTDKHTRQVGFSAELFIDGLFLQGCTKSRLLLFFFFFFCILGIFSVVMERVSLWLDVCLCSGGYWQKGFQSALRLEDMCLGIGGGGAHVAPAFNL